MSTLRKYRAVALVIAMGCGGSKTADDQLQRELRSIDLYRGEVALCGASDGTFGKVGFSLSCTDAVRADFNLAIALLHSFEYTEAEKVFAKVIDADPQCLMAYWGVAMSNFHPLWAPPANNELEKGSRVIALARTLQGVSARESDYLEAVATVYDDWDKLDHRTRVLKFEEASGNIYKTYPDDAEAAVFYALALRAAADPSDKSFARQRKAGEILNAIFTNQPEHPGIAHYLIHVYDYPELADLALPAARKYASIAATSAHALHMPSHIFTRLGLWNEAIHSNLNSVSAARCYAESSGMKGHWDEELHGIDYLVYAYLQQGRDDSAAVQLEYMRSIDIVSPLNNKVAYTFAAVPTRFALECKNWEEALALELKPGFPWGDFPWERALVSFGRVLGAVHLGQRDAARAALDELRVCYDQLMASGKTYEANQVRIQIVASEAWMEFLRGDLEQAITHMADAAAMEDATEKHPVTPGEVVPARELLADMLLQAGKFADALEAYKADLRRHPGRFNGLYGAGMAALKTGNTKEAVAFFKQLTATAGPTAAKRRELAMAESYLKQHL